MADEKLTKQGNGKPSKSVTVFLVFLAIVFVLFLIFIYSFTTTKQSELFFEYNGFDFKKDDFGYQLQLYINDASYPAIVKVRNKPQDLEYIPIDDISFLTDKKELYLIIDPTKGLTGKTTVAALEIDAFLDNEFLYNIPVHSAFTEPYGEGTVKTCADVTEDEGVIWLDTGKETKVFVENGCLFIHGVDEDELIMAADRLVLTLLGVME